LAFHSHTQKRGDKCNVGEGGFKNWKNQGNRFARVGPGSRDERVTGRERKGRQGSSSCPGRLTERARKQKQQLLWRSIQGEKNKVKRGG